MERRVPDPLINLCLYLFAPTLLLHVATALRTLWGILLGEPLGTVAMWAIPAIGLMGLAGLFWKVGIKSAQSP